MKINIFTCDSLHFENESSTSQLYDKKIDTIHLSCWQNGYQITNVFESDQCGSIIFADLDHIIQRMRR